MVYVCSWCKSGADGEKWDESTYADCVSRDMKRKYMNISKGKNRNDKYYKCPNCERYASGINIKATK